MSESHDDWSVRDAADALPVAQPTRGRRRLWLWRLVFTVSALSTALVTFVRTTITASAETGPTTATMADPDSYFDPASDTHVTLATSTLPDACNSWRIVPWIWSPSPTLDLTNRCPSGDLMPGGVGAWADSGLEGAWAPSLSFFNGTYYLHYTATKAGTRTPQFPSGQKCIGRATASSPLGPFVDWGEVVCPGGGRWAIDPDVLVVGGTGYMTYRDDAVISGASTGISIAQLDGKGFGIWNTRRTAEISPHVNWDNYKLGNETIGMIENPSLINTGGSNNRYHLFYSGNQWDTNNYATGLSDCGTSILSGGDCAVVGGVTAPYFGYSGRAGAAPQQLLPQDRPGPGGLSVFHVGGHRSAVWHYYNPNGRRALAGEATVVGTTWKIA